MDDFTMDAEEDNPKGRASALFMFAVLSGITFVLSSAHWLSDLHISLAPFYAWEIILFSFTMFSIAGFVLLKDNRGHVMDSVEASVHDPSSESELTSGVVDDDHRMREPLWTRIPLRVLALIACCVGSIIMPVYELYRAIDNLSCFNIESTGLLALLKLKCISAVFYVLICVVMVLFLVRFRHRSSKSSEMKVLISSLAASYTALIINVIMNIIWTSDTMEENLEKPMHNITEKRSEIDTSGSELMKELMYLKCENNFGYIDTVATYFYKYTYQFPLQFALLSFCYLGSIWNIIPRFKRRGRILQLESRSRNTSTNNFNDTENTAFGSSRADPETEPLIERTHSVPKKIWLRKLKSAAMETFLFICNYIAVLTTILVIGIFALHLYTEIKDDTFDDENVILDCYDKNRTCTDSANSIVQTFYTYLFSIVAFIGFMVARKERKAYDFFNSIDILFLISAGGHLLLILFETLDNVQVIVENNTNNNNAEKVLFSFKTFCRVIGLYSQTIFVIKASKLQIRHKSLETGKHVYIKATVVFLFVSNLEIWLADSFLEPTVLQYNENTNYGQAYGHKNWFFLTQLLYPFVTLYRLLTTVMCYEACVRFKHKMMHNHSLFRP